MEKFSQFNASLDSGSAPGYKASTSQEKILEVIFSQQLLHQFVCHFGTLGADLIQIYLEL